ncbi:MAG: hypothetical protein K2M50_06135 [Treponemataceae bacterium]|nr:hypothetical protein [Treponemataceae bacterium]
MKYIITIEEMISEDFEVEAECAEEAMNIAEEKYNKCEFVLEPGNLTFKQMAIMYPENEATGWTKF